MKQKNISKSYKSIAKIDQITSDTSWDLLVQFLHDHLEKKLGNEQIKNLNFHIESDDYFGTVATIINLILQDKRKDKKYLLATLSRLKKDLMFLQKNYKIIKKDKKEK